METVAAIEVEEETTGASASLPPAVAENDEDSEFQDVFASTSSADSSNSNIDTTKAIESLVAVDSAAETLVANDTLDNRLWFVSATQDATKEVATTLDDADLSSFEDIEKLKEVQVEIDATSNELSDKSEAAVNEETSQVVDIASDLMTDAGDSLEAVIEVSEVDAEKGDELAQVLLESLEGVGNALNGSGTPLELLQNAGQIMNEGKTTIMGLFEAYMGYAFMSMVIDERDNDAQEASRQQRIMADQTNAEDASDDAMNEDANVSVASGSMAASTGVDLSGWKLTLPADHDGDGEADEIDDTELSAFGSNANIQHNADGSITFSSLTDEAATTANSKYPRSELREMIRSGDTSIDTSDPANNWVTSAASADEQAAAGGVDGQMRATLSVDRVTEGGDAEQAGRVVIGQVHAVEDEPVRLYYHKSPGSEKGAIYFAHEPQNGEPETFHELIGDTSGMAPDGIALGEAFTYDINITGTDLTVSVTTKDGQQYSETVDMAKSGYADAGTQMYFKAGVYSQNDSTPDPSTDYAEATFYSLETGHDGEALGGGANPGDVFAPGGDSGQDTGGIDDGDGTGGTEEANRSIQSGDGLSADSSTDGDPSGENQAALESRYISLYEALMEKQIAFKEAVEPYKTDNQNAGKG